MLQGNNIFLPDGFLSGLKPKGDCLISDDELAAALLTGVAVTLGRLERGAAAGETRLEGGGVAVLVLGLCSLDEGGDFLAWFATFSSEPREPND